MRLYHRLFIRAAMLLSLSGATPVLAAWDVANNGLPYNEVEISSSEGTWISVDVSPDGANIVFDMLGDLFIMPATGGEAVPLRQGPAIDRIPRFSPDGAQIAFIGDGGGYDNVWVMDANGANTRQVSTETQSWITLPAWTANSSHLVARRLSVEGYTTPHPFGRHLWLLNKAGGAGQKFIETDNAVTEPSLSRDGKWIYYTENVSPLSFSKIDPDNANLVVKRRNLATGQTATLISGYGGAFSPQISPDGNLLAFVRRVSTKTVLFVYDLKLHKEVAIFDGLSRDIKVHPAGDGFYPSYGWFPDNRHIAIWAKGKLLKIDMQTGAVTPIPFHATSTHKITRTGTVKRKIADADFVAKSIGRTSTSADGKSVVFSAVGHIWMKRLPDSKPVRLTGENDYAYDPIFSPSGRTVLYVAWNDAEGSKLQLLDLKSKRIKTVTSIGGIVASPVFSHDGGKIAFQVDRPNPFFGGYHQQPGIYWTPVSGGEPHLVTSDGFNPEFTASGERLYINLAHQGPNRLSILKSVALNGTDAREHVRSSHGHHFRLSPDGQWLAFQDNHSLYVTPYFETSAVMNVSATAEDFPVTQLSRHRSQHPHWTKNSKQLSWLSGDTYYSVPTAELLTPEGPHKKEYSLDLVVHRDTPEGVIVLTGAQIITMNGDEILENGALVITGDHITAIGDANDIRPPASAKVYDLAGKTIMPGLVDAHVHLLLGQQPNDIAPQQFSRYYANLAYGVTTTFDPYAPTQLVFRLAEMVKSGRMVGPRIFSTGAAFMGFPSSPLTDVRIESMESAREHIQRMKEVGAISIKSYIQPGRIERQQIVAAAHAQGMLATPEGEGHFYHDLSMILDGFDTVEHNLPVELYNDVVQLFANSQTASTPTLMVNQAELNGMQYYYQRSRIWEMEKMQQFAPVARGFDRPFKPLWAHARTIMAPDEVYDIGFRAMARSLRQLNDAGVTVNLGSHGEIDGIGAIWELWLINQGGLSNHDTLRIGTINGARTLGLDAEIGSLEPGKLADLIVLDGNPLADIGALDSVRYTMINGRLYDSRTMNEIGNRERTRRKFYWEAENQMNINWNESMIGGVIGEAAGISPDID